MKKWFQKKFQKLGMRHNRLFILPTAYGLYFLGITFILFLISLSYGHSLAFTTTFIFVALIMTSAHFTNFNLSGIEVLTFRCPHDIHADEPFTIHLTLRNTSIKVRFDIEASFREGDVCHAHTLKPGEVRTIEVELKGMPRGHYRGQRVRLSSTFPFGLFRVWKYWNQSFDFIIYPAIGAKVPLPSPAFASHERGKIHNKIELGAEEFYGHFTYEEGMPLRSIDWRAYARGRGILLKKFIEKSDGLYLFSLEEQEGEREEALKQMASLIEVAEVRGVSYAVVLERENPIFGSGFSFKRECLKRLAIYDQEVREVSL